MGKPIVKLTDIYTNPLMNGASAPIACPGSTSLFVDKLPVVQLIDALSPVSDIPLPGMSTVLHNGTPLNAMGGQTSMGGALLTGSFTVLIG
ncbi:MAG: putative Zn-binding protein involved in type VI secretion [Crocinitomicaceae bacterium]|jgi:uncharacterized Zn-binding protein involved in type VI secretion